MSPLVGGTSPAMALKRVVLPAPLAPMILTVSPRQTFRDTRSRARTPPKRTVRSSSSRIAPSSTVEAGREPGGAPGAGACGANGVRRAKTTKSVGERDEPAGQDQYARNHNRAE